MCKPASFVSTKYKVYQSKTSDSHEDIIYEFELNPDGVRGPNVVRTEIAPPGGDLSLPLKYWVFKVDQDRLPAWFDAVVEEKRCRQALKEWKKAKLTGWKVHEAFHPVNPLLLKPKKMSDKRKEKLTREWASVLASAWYSVGDSVRDLVWASAGASFGDSIRDSVWRSVSNSIRDSVCRSVGNPVRASVIDSVWAYIGGLFPNITSWKYAKKLGPDPWRPLLTLWYAGYVPSFDGVTWRLHAGNEAKVVFELTIK